LKDFIIVKDNFAYKKGTCNIISEDEKE